MLFQEIIGLSALKQTLVQSVQHQHVAHAQLFLGREGAPHLALALAYAQYLLCEQRGANDACGRCSACVKSHKYIHPDMHFVLPMPSIKKSEEAEVSASQAYAAEWRKLLLTNPFPNLSLWLEALDQANKQALIAVDEARKIIKTLSLKPYEGEYKILLIWLPEYLNSQAANALLKVLEEPPPQTIFLLVSNDNKNLLPTILSRVQLVQVPSYGDAEVALYLQDRYALSPEAAQSIAYLADGNLSHAIHLHTNTAYTQDDHLWFRQWMRACYQVWNNTERRLMVADLVQYAEEFADMHKDAQKSLLHYGLGVCRESLLVQGNASHLLRVNGEKLTFVHNFSRTLNLDKIQLLYEELNQALYHLERNASAKILFLAMSLRIAQAMYT